MPADPTVSRLLVEEVVRLAGREATDERGLAPVSVCSIMVTDVDGENAAHAHMDGANLASEPTARNKALTVLWYDRNTHFFADKLAAGEWVTWNVIAATNACPFFCPYDGGIKVYTKAGVFVAALAVSARTGLGDRRLAVMAAHNAGYKTDFDELGYTAVERGRLGAHPMLACD